MKNTHVAVQQKPTQHCKAIMLQPEKNLKIKFIKIQFLEISKLQIGRRNLKFKCEKRLISKHLKNHHKQRRTERT